MAAISRAAKAAITVRIETLLMLAPGEPKLRVKALTDYPLSRNRGFG